MIKNVISFINMKGGVGKTTLCIGLGEYLAHYCDSGKKILFIDLDPQFNTTQSLMNLFEREDQYINEYIKNNQTINRIFDSPTRMTEKPEMPTPKDIIIELDEKMHIILGTIDLIFQDNMKSSSTTKRVKKFIDDNNLKDQYDYIFIDCPPTISLFTDAALMASDYYLIPNRIDRYSILGIKLLTQVIERLKHDEELSIESLGIVYTMLDGDTKKTIDLKNTFEQTEIVQNIYSKSREEMKCLSYEFLERVQNNV